MFASSYALDSDWWTASSWADPETPAFTIQGSGVVEYLWSSAIPLASSQGLPLAAGAYKFSTIMPGQLLWFRVVTGSADIYYLQDVGVQFDLLSCGVAWLGDGGADTGFIGPQQSVTVGFNDNIQPPTTGPYEHAAFLCTNPANINASDSIDNSWLTVPLLAMRPGRVLRFYGLEYSSSQYSSITDLASLQALTKTVSYADFETGPESIIRVDVTSIVVELQFVSGWSSSSPLQFYVEDVGAEETGLNVFSNLWLNSKSARVVTVVDGSGSSSSGTGSAGTSTAGP